MVSVLRVLTSKLGLASVAAVVVLPCSAFLSGCSRAPDKAGQAPSKAEKVQSEVKISDDGADSAEPAITADPDGNLYVIYVEHAADKSADLFLQKFDSSSRRSGSKVRINPDPGTVKAWAGDAPTIVIGPDNTIFVGWTDRAAGGGTNFVLSSSRDGGASFSEPTKINDDAGPASHGMHSLAVDRKGTLFAAWLDERNTPKAPAEEMAMDAESDSGFHVSKIDHKVSGSSQSPEPNSEVFFASSTDGGRTFSKNQRIAENVCPCCKTAVTTSSGGKIYVSWRQVLEGEYRHIAVAASTDAGKSFSPGPIVSDDRWQIAACPVSGAAIYAGSDQELSVAWYTAGDAGQAGYYTAKAIDGGETFGKRLFVGGDGASGTPTIVDTNTGPVLVMASQDDQVTTARISDQGGSYDVQTGVLRGARPAAAFANGSIYIGFVRNENKKRSIWVAKL
jgi:hypothetical protein